MELLSLQPGSSVATMIRASACHRYRFASFLLMLLWAFGIISVDIAGAADAPSSGALAVAPQIIDNEQRVIENLADPGREQLALENRSRTFARTYPLPNLEVVSVNVASTGALQLSHRPSFRNKIGDRYASVTPNNNFVFYTIDPDLQEFVSEIVDRAPTKHVAIVAMDPKTGKIRAIAGKSISIDDIEYHAGFPAASLFKVVTAAAAVE